MIDLSPTVKEELEDALARGGPSLGRIEQTLRDFGLEIIPQRCVLCNGTGVVTPGFVNLHDPCPCTSPCICPPSTNETIPGCPIHAPR